MLLHAFLLLILGNSVPTQQKIFHSKLKRKIIRALRKKFSPSHLGICQSLHFQVPLTTGGIRGEEHFKLKQKSNLKTESSFDLLQQTNKQTLNFGICMYIIYNITPFQIILFSMIYFLLLRSKNKKRNENVNFFDLFY